MATNESIADKLVGYTLESGWKIIRKHNNTAMSHSGGVYSMCFDVEKDGVVMFMKALDFHKHLHSKECNEDEVKAIHRMTEQFLYETLLSERCEKGHVTKVLYMKESHQEQVPIVNILVPYMIFDLANYDLHEKLEISDRFDFAWKLKSLHDVAVGLQQLHKVKISHQDIKPSNILVFDDDSKISDLGCSLCDDIKSPFGEDIFPGDHNYAPPEKSYHISIKPQDIHDQKYLTDCYLLGSLMTYYVTSSSFNGIMYKYVPECYQPKNYKGDFDAIKSYLIDAYRKALEEIKECIPDTMIKDKMLSNIKYLCHPLSERRGHPKNIAATHSNNYDLERFISDINYMKGIAELSLFKKK